MLFSVFKCILTKTGTESGETIHRRVGRGMKSTNKGWTEGERKTRVDVLRNNDIKMAKAWMIY